MMDPDAKTWLNDDGVMYSLNDVLAGLDAERPAAELSYEIKMYDMGGGNSIAVLHMDGKTWAEAGDMPDEALIGLLLDSPLYEHLKPILK